MLTINAPLSLDDIGILLAGLQASASAHRGPKNALALKVEAKRNQLTSELTALQSELLEQITGKPAIPAPAAEKPASKAAAKKVAAPAPPAAVGS